MTDDNVDIHRIYGWIVHFFPGLHTNVRQFVRQMRKCLDGTKVAEKHRNVTPLSTLIFKVESPNSPPTDQLEMCMETMKSAFNDLESVKRTLTPIMEGIREGVVMKSYNLGDMRKRVKTMTTKLKDSEEKLEELGKDELAYLIAYLHMGMITMKVDSDTEEEQPEIEG